MKKYTRDCPGCGKELSYGGTSGLNRAIRNNARCKSCAKSGKNNTMWGKKHSTSTKKQMSKSHGGNGELDQKWPGHAHWAKRVKQRDDYICQHCHLDGLPHEMDAHHIVPKSKYPQYYLDLDNGQTLCRECHRIEHFKKPNNPWGK